MRRHFTKKLSAIAPYEDYIVGRWQQGCRNATQIWREISEQGYPGAYKNVVRITRYLKEQERLAKPVPDRPPGISASHAAGILVKRPENRSEGEIRTLQRLKAVHRITQRCCTLFEEFAVMLRDKQQRNAEQAHGQLEAWTERAKASGIAEMKAFAVKLLQDSEAVVAAMTCPLQPGTNRRKGKQTQAREALDVWAREVRPPAPARALRGELKERASRAESPRLRFTRFSEESRKRGKPNRGAVSKTSRTVNDVGARSTKMSECGW